MTNYEFIKDAMRLHGRAVLFEATHVTTGVRSRYRMGEHLNVGIGWLMMSVDNLAPPCVPDIKLKDIVVLEPQG